MIIVITYLAYYYSLCTVIEVLLLNFVYHRSLRLICMCFFFVAYFSGFFSVKLPTIFGE